MRKIFLSLILLISSLIVVFPANHTQAASSFIMPTEGKITSGFGYRIHPITGERKLHAGIDIAKSGTVPVVASASGTVSYSGTMSGYGNVVRIKHTINGQNFETLYAHLSSRSVNAGAKVSQGQRIGYQGSTGNVTGQHLHFEIHLGSYSGNSSAVDPIDYIGKSLGPEMYGIAIDDISLSKAQELVPKLQKQYSSILAADLIYGTKDGSGYKIVIKNINHKQAVEMVPQVQSKTASVVPNYDRSKAYGVGMGTGTLVDSTPYEIHVTGLTLEQAQILVPSFQQDYAGIVLAQRVQGVHKGNGVYKVILEGFTLEQAQVVRNQIAAANSDIPNDKIYGYGL